MNLKKTKRKKDRILILYIPVIHRGFIDFIKTIHKGVSNVFIIDDSLIKELSEYEPNIASITQKDQKILLNTLNIHNVKILNSNNIRQLKNASLTLINDEISRNLYAKYFKNNQVLWKNVFLRWDRNKVLSKNDVNTKTTTLESDIYFMKVAYEEAKNSSDWWRQVGAVLVKDGKEVLRSYNKGLPTDYTPYQEGAIRDYLKVGENPELSSTIHAEQTIISRAAKIGISTLNTKLYITHFPCPVCAKLIAVSGIKACYFAKGSSTADGKSVLKSGKVKLVKVKL
jgi:dCMP deaminase